MTGSFHIRPVTVADFAAIATITNHYILNTNIHFGYTPQTAEELCAQWQEHVDTHPYIVAVRDASPGAEVLGYAKVSIWRTRAAYSRTAESGIYVAPQAHRQGIGRAMYQDLITRCRGVGLHTLVAGITVPNEPSCRLHEALGFTYVGTFDEVGYKFEKWWGTAWYQLML